MKLYTVIAEFLGGLLIRQVRAAGQKEALLAWARARHPEFDELEEFDRSYVSERAKQGTCSHVSDFTNVWVWTGVMLESGETLTVYLVETSDSSA